MTVIKEEIEKLDVESKLEHQESKNRVSHRTRITTIIWIRIRIYCIMIHSSVSVLPLILISSLFMGSISITMVKPTSITPLEVYDSFLPSLLPQTTLGVHVVLLIWNLLIDTNVKMRFSIWAPQIILLLLMLTWWLVCLIDHGGWLKHLKSSTLMCCSCIF